MTDPLKPVSEMSDVEILEYISQLRAERETRHREANEKKSAPRAGRPPKSDAETDILDAILRNEGIIS